MSSADSQSNSPKSSIFTLLDTFPEAGRRGATVQAPPMRASIVYVSPGDFQRSEAGAAPQAAEDTAGFDAEEPHSSL